MKLTVMPLQEWVVKAWAEDVTRREKPLCGSSWGEDQRRTLTVERHSERRIARGVSQGMSSVYPTCPVMHG